MTSRRGARKGGVTVLVAATMAALLGTAAWVVDIAAGLHVRTKQQAAADAGALGAAWHLIPPENATLVDDGAVKAAGVNWVGRNGFSIPQGKVNWYDTPKPGLGEVGRRTVVVGWEQPVKTSFAAIFGVEQYGVAARAAATLGAPTEIPKGMLPFGVPAYKDATGQWFALSTADGKTYNPLIPYPATELVLKIGSGNGNSGNYMALALDGTGSTVYEETIRNGSRKPLGFHTVVPTEPGDMVGPTKKAIGDLLGFGGKALHVFVPLVKRSEWEENSGRASITVIGFAAAKITKLTNKAEVFATFEQRVIPVPAQLTRNDSPGVLAPILVLPPS